MSVTPRPAAAGECACERRPEGNPPPPALAHGARLYVYGLDDFSEVVAFYDAPATPGSPLWYGVQDGNSNVTGVFDGSGTPYQQYAYAPYGATLAVEDGTGAALPSTTPRAQSLAFQGMWPHPTTGLYFTPSGRCYDPALGRWLRRDPRETAILLGNVLRSRAQTAQAMATFSAAGQYADGMNPYQFVGSNPVGLRDPSGEIVPLLLFAGPILGAVLGGAGKYMALKARAADLTMSDREFWVAVGASAFVGSLLGLGSVGVGALAGQAFGLTAEGGAAVVAAMMGADGMARGTAGMLTAETELDSALARVEFASGGLMLVGGLYGGRFGQLKVVQISRSRYPEAAAHMIDAQNAGHPRVVTVLRAGKEGRRKLALQGRPKVPGKQLDEYPPAMFKEGGAGASVRAISEFDNQGAGSTMGQQLRGVPVGTRVIIDVVP